MIRFLIKIAVVLIIGILVYNYFFGTSDEKETSKKVFGEVKELAVSIKDLVKSEKTKFDAGKYDDAIQKINSAVNSVKSQVHNNKNLTNEMKQLEKKRALVNQEVEDLKAEKDLKQDDPRIDILNQDLKSLSDQLEIVSKKMHEQD
jgi:cell division protein FtsL